MEGTHPLAQGDPADAEQSLSPKPLLTTALAALDDTIACAVAARDTPEVDPVDTVRLESLVQMLRDQRGRLHTILHTERNP